MSAIPENRQEDKGRPADGLRERLEGLAARWASWAEIVGYDRADVYRYCAEGLRRVLAECDTDEPR